MKTACARTCPACGKTFATNYLGKRYCTPRCRSAFHRPGRDVRPEAVTDTPTPSAPRPDNPDPPDNKRHCHDCGAPTADYRCKPCRRKWAIKNHVDLCEVVGL